MNIINKAYNLVEDFRIFLNPKSIPEFIITKKYNHKMFLDITDSLKLSKNGDWERFAISLLEKEIKEGDTVLDLGANIGYYTLIMAKIVGDKGKVYAFEADPTNFNILKRNIEVNGYKNVILENKAVLDKNEIVNFYINKKNRAGNSLFQGKNSTYRADKYNKVEGIKLDDYFKSEEIDFIKIDIEGSEFKAMKGMVNLLKRNDGIKVITEFYPMLLIGVGENGNPEEYLNLLDKLNFKLYDIIEGSNDLILSTPQDILNKYGAKSELTNLFCKR